MQYEIGRVSLLGNRTTNQDRIGSIESHGGVVLVLGDGLGGKPGGDLAADTLVKSVEHSLRHEIMPVESPQQLLRKLVLNAHRAVLKVGEAQDPPITPGSTAVICLVQNRTAWWAHVGDSRLYLIRNGLPLYRTQDHSFVEQLYQEGRISIEKRQGHPMRNYVTQCIGLVEKEPEMIISNGVELQVGDVLLLCSDGFWEPLDDAQIGANLAESRIKDAINKLAQRAEQISYPRSDNTTAIGLRVISLQDVSAEKQAAQAKSGKPPKDPIDGAIKNIEDTIRYYQDEMNKE